MQYYTCIYVLLKLISHPSKYFLSIKITVSKKSRGHIYIYIYIFFFFFSNMRGHKEGKDSFGSHTIPTPWVIITIANTKIMIMHSCWLSLSLSLSHTHSHIMSRCVDCFQFSYLTVNLILFFVRYAYHYKILLLHLYSYLGAFPMAYEWLVPHLLTSYNHMINALKGFEGLCLEAQLDRTNLGFTRCFQLKIEAYASSASPLQEEKP